MNDHPTRDVLSALVDGECGPDERRWVHEHLNACDDCRRAASEFTAVQGLVAGLPKIVAPEDFVAHVLKRRPLAVLRGRMRYVAAAAASVAVGVSLAGFAAPPEEEQPPVDVFLTRHVGSQDPSVIGGQVLFAVHR